MGNRGSIPCRRTPRRWFFRLVAEQRLRDPLQAARHAVPHGNRAPSGGTSASSRTSTARTPVGRGPKGREQTLFYTHRDRPKEREQTLFYTHRGQPKEREQTLFYTPLGPAEGERTN